MIETTDATCSGAMSSAHDGRDVQMVVIGFDAAHPRGMCAACRASAERLGLPFRPWVERHPERDRRVLRFLLPREQPDRRTHGTATRVDLSPGAGDLRTATGAVPM